MKTRIALAVAAAFSLSAQLAEAPHAITNMMTTIEREER